jgi:hypothetical protein
MQGGIREQGENGPDVIESHVGIDYYMPPGFQFMLSMSVAGSYLKR